MLQPIVKTIIVLILLALCIWGVGFIAGTAIPALIIKCIYALLVLLAVVAIANLWGLFEPRPK